LAPGSPAQHVIERSEIHNEPPVEMS